MSIIFQFKDQNLTMPELVNANVVCGYHFHMEKVPKRVRF